MEKHHPNKKSQTCCYNKAENVVRAKFFIGKKETAKSQWAPTSKYMASHIKKITCQSIKHQSLSHAITQSTNQSTSQSIEWWKLDLSINQSINHSRSHAWEGDGSTLGRVNFRVGHAARRGIALSVNNGHGFDVQAESYTVSAVPGRKWLGPWRSTRQTGRIGSFQSAEIQVGVLNSGVATWFAIH